jgi:hypothetical protein
MDEPIIFYGKNITIHIPNTTNVICKNAFKGCQAKIKIPKKNSIRVIEEEAFSYSLIDSIRLDSVQYIGKSCFYGDTILKSLIITSDSLKAISFVAFGIPAKTHNFCSITLPRSVIQLEMGALATNLKELTVAWSQPLKLSKKDYIFGGLALSRCTLRVPKGTVPAYRTAPCGSSLVR